MTTWRCVRDLVEEDAPLVPSRALAVAVAVARHLEWIEEGGTDPGILDSRSIQVAADGSVRIATDAPGRGPVRVTAPGSPDPGTGGGATIGRLLVELLTGRPPLGREDAFEPVVTGALSAAACSLVARSISDAPGQWPDAATWRRALEAASGGQAPPLPPADAARARRRRAAAIAGLVLLVAATVVVLVLAPRWWAQLALSGP